MPPQIWPHQRGWQDVDRDRFLGCGGWLSESWVCGDCRDLDEKADDKAAREETR